MIGFKSCWFLRLKLSITPPKPTPLRNSFENLTDDDQDKATKERVKEVEDNNQVTMDVEEHKVNAITENATAEDDFV